MSELGPEARSIIEAGREGDEPTRADRSRVRASLMATLGVGGAGAAAAGTAVKSAAASMAPKAAAGVAGVTLANSAASGTLIAAAKFFVVVSMLGGVTYGSVVLTRDAAPANSAALNSTSRVAPVAAEVPAAKQSTPSTIPEVTPPSNPPVETPKSEVMPTPVRPLPAVASSDPLKTELGELAEARGALQNGNPDRALSLLDAQNHTFATGQMAEERTVMGVLALCKAGRVDEAKAAAARFVAEHPRSPLVDRARTACSE